jgi:ribose transport system substrate-binding protein
MKRIQIVMLLIVALLLASCGTTPEAPATPTIATEPTSGAADTATTAPTQAAAETPTEAAQATQPASGSTTGKRVRVAYTVPTLDSAFFTTLGEGAKKAADDFGVDLTFVGANLDVATQVKQVEDFIQKGVDVLIIQGADSAGIVAAVNAAEKAGVPVVTTGDKPDAGKITTHIGFDNVESGVIGADFIGKQLGGKGNVVELIGRLGTASGREKSEGLKQGLAKYPDMKIVASQPAEFQREKALSVMENIIQAQPKIDAVYAANDDMALGALQALKASGRDKGVVIVGNDGIDDAIAAIQRGEMAATNATPPYRQGYIGVEVAVRIGNNQPVPALVKEKNELITKENVGQAQTIMKGVDPANRYWEAQFPSK